MNADHKLKELKERIDKKIRELDFFHKKKFFHNDYFEALKYPLIVGGKRTRPIITLLLAESCNLREGFSQVAENFALAIELIHTYSLVHDDLPCMDDDKLRRGHPTSHVIYGEAKALLIGDALLTGAFELLSYFDSSFKISFEEFSILSTHATRILSQASGMSGMVYGQWCDLSFENSSELSLEAVFATHNHKTGKLIAASFQIGVLFFLISNKVKNWDKINTLLNLSSSIGEDIGLIFQIIDDILDVTGDEESLGKTSKKDLHSNKLTVVKVLGLKESQKISRELLSQIFLKMEALYKALGKLDLVPNENWNILEDYLKYLLKRKS